MPYYEATILDRSEEPIVSNIQVLLVALDGLSSGSFTVENGDRVKFRKDGLYTLKLKDGGSSQIKVRHILYKSGLKASVMFVTDGAVEK